MLYNFDIIEMIQIRDLAPIQGFSHNYCQHYSLLYHDDLFTLWKLTPKIILITVFWLAIQKELVLRLIVMEATDRMIAVNIVICHHK